MPSCQALLWCALDLTFTDERVGAPPPLQPVPPAPAAAAPTPQAIQAAAGGAAAGSAPSPDKRFRNLKKKMAAFKESKKKKNPAEMNWHLVRQQFGKGWMA